MTLPRFSLRMLLLAVAVLCAWLAWERSVVMQRRTMRTRYAGQYLFVTIAPEGARGVELAAVPRSRMWLFADEPVQSILLPIDSPQTAIDEAASLFPEAYVDRLRPDPGPPVW